MSLRFTVLVCLLAVLAAGCGHKELPFTDNSRDTEMYAKNIRHMIELNCNAARSGDPATHLAPLIQELDRDDRPVGDYREVFLELRQECRKTVDIVRANLGSRPNLTTHLDRMIELASKLPKKDAFTNRPPVELGS